MRGWAGLAVAAMLLGGFLRWSGLDRDVVDFVVSQNPTARQGQAYYSFHPDENSVVSGALALDDPLHPPFTMYGALPFYVLRSTLAALDRVGVAVQHETTIHRVAKALSAALASLCLLVVWHLGRRLLSPATAALAVLFLAVAPAAIQQAHYGTVDSLFCLLTTASLAAILGASQRPSWRASIVAGVLIGLAASVRLNALLLGPVLVVAHLTCQGSTGDRWRQRLADPRLWASCGAIVVTTVAIQPWLLLSPMRLWTVEGANDFAHVMTIVRGATPQLYTLQYTGTTPFLYQWTHLLPLAFGWPMTVATALGLGFALRSLDARRGVLVLWIGLYLLTAGPLFVKPVRYLLPIVPPLLLLAADLCRWCWSQAPGKARWVLRLAVLSVVVHAVLYGLAYHNVWSQEDSRIQAGRWIAENVPAGARIAVEQGAFPLGPVIDSQRYEQADLGISTFFNARGQLLSRTIVNMLDRRLGGADYVAITDVNRLTNLTAAPEALPVVASFYRHLTQEQLGYRLVRRFKVYPELWGLRFNDDGAEHSFLGFDHPAVLLFARDPEAQARAAWDLWAEGLAGESFDVDADLDAGVAALRRGDTDQATRLFDQASGNPVSGTLARLLVSLARSQADKPGEPVAVHWIVAMSLADLGLPATALQLLTDVAPSKTCSDAPGYAMIAENLSRLEYDAQAAAVLRLASTLCDP
ncbi:MAG: glycosyltransferase family 39 protein [bacterium]|nr:glycosyltransferase family 39 protein [bacterium]